MDELPLVVEGFENKIKRLFVQIDQLKSEKVNLQLEISSLKSSLKEEKANVSDLNGQLQKLKVAKVLEGSDSFQAKQQINDLLREIEKCYALLNR